MALGYFLLCIPLEVNIKIRDFEVFKPFLQSFLKISPKPFFGSSSLKTISFGECLLYPKGIILNKHNIYNQAVTYHFNFIFKGDQYSCNEI